MSIELSVVIPTLGRPALLARCLKALITQSLALPRYEIIIVTDGPDEQTRRTINNLAGSMHFKVNLLCFSLPKKKGPAAARNAGWKKARGNLIVFTDDDCIPACNFLEKYLKQSRLYYGRPVAFAGKTIVPLATLPTDHEKNIARLEQAHFITANCAISRTALELTNGFDEDFTMAWREDTAMEFSLIDQDIPILKIREAVVFHPVRPAEWGISLQSEKKNMFNALLYRKHTELYNRNINTRPTTLYYSSVICSLTLAAAPLLPWVIPLMALSGWLCISGKLALKRLNGTSKHPSHVSEMIVTSLFIPVLSVFWNSYGCIRFKSFLL